MKYLIVVLLFMCSLNLIAQNEFKNINCMVEMTIKDILNDGFEKDCIELKNKMIVSFQVKVPKQKTVFVKGNLLNYKATDYISRLKVGDKIVIFNIKLNDNTSIPSIIVTIKE